MKLIVSFCSLALCLFAKAQVTPQNSNIQIQQVKAKPVPSVKLSVIKTKSLELNTCLKQLTDSIQTIKILADEIKKQTDSQSELNEEQSLKMQMIMERMQKANTAASNLMKKFSEIQQSIIANMK